MSLECPEYPKIQTIYKRDEGGSITLGEYSTPEIEYLSQNEWSFTEKVDGTNIRVWLDGKDVRFGGRTDRAQIPLFLLDKLNDLFPADALSAALDADKAILYGEGYGDRIQKAGKRYIPGGVGFILFDIRVGRRWLTREAIEEIADKLGIPAVPILFTGNLEVARLMCEKGFVSSVAADEMLAEGVVGRPVNDLYDQTGRRIIAKLKHKDFTGGR